MSMYSKPASLPGFLVELMLLPCCKGLVVRGLVKGSTERRRRLSKCFGTRAKGGVVQASLVRRHSLPSDANPELTVDEDLCDWPSAISGCKIPRMPNTTSYAALCFGITSVSSMLPARAAAAGKVA